MFANIYSVPGNYSDISELLKTKINKPAVEIFASTSEVVVILRRMC